MAWLKSLGLVLLAVVLTVIVLAIGLAILAFSSILSVIFLVGMVFTVIWFILRLVTCHPSRK